jgi:sulfite reductase beta subunit-like hemoprotein
MADPRRPAPDVSEDENESSGEAITLLNATLDRMSKVEKTKVQSEGLFWVSGKGERHSFASEIDGLSRGDAETLSGGAADLSKHFGIYKQQERIEGRKNGPYIFMIRLKCPAGGEISPEQWQALDEAADRFADGTLRLTTRQSVQFHHVTGKNLGPLVRFLNQNYRDRGYKMSTLGACGDVNRNTMCSPIDDLDAELPLRSAEIAHEIARELTPRAGAEAYRQIFLEDEENQRLVPLEEEEPIYGEHYLPRKFKVGIAHPNDGSVDLLTQDVGLLPVVEGQRVAELYDLYAGGGLGITHNKPDTQQLLGLYLGRIPRAQCVAAVRAIAIIQKENGERGNRKHARFKYTIRRLGVDTVKRMLRERFEIALVDAEPQPLPDNRFFHGWTRQAGTPERWVLGIPIESGRLRDANGVNQRSAVRQLVSELQLGVRLTGNQDLLLCHIPAEKRARVEQILAEHGCSAEPRGGLTRRQSLACPAKPTCGLAMTEAEGILPLLMNDLEAAGLGDTDVVVRIAGCPNSCSRPPSAEIGIIGYGKNHHIIQVGGLRNGGRIGHVLYDRVPATELSNVVIGIARAIRAHAGSRPAGEFLADTPPDQLRSWVGHAE